MKTRRVKKWRRENMVLKAWHHLKLKVRQFFCVHGNYAYLELTTQRRPETGKVIVYARGCKKCGWINHAGSYSGMPRTLRNSYDRTYLKITNKDDRLHSDVRAEKEKRDRQLEFERRKKVVV